MTSVIKNVVIICWFYIKNCIFEHMADNVSGDCSPWRFWLPTLTPLGPLPQIGSARTVPMAQTAQTVKRELINWSAVVIEAKSKFQVSVSFRGW